MIDRLIATAPLGAIQDHHRRRLAQVLYDRLSTTKIKPTTTYINSPITGAQIEVNYWIDNATANPMAYASVEIPLASATVGQNYAHAGLDSICWEVRCAAWLTRVVLTSCGFWEEEIELFMKQTEVQLLELTWHTRTDSKRAQRNLMQRTLEAFKSRRQLSGRHDILVRDVDFREKNNAPGLLVTFKTGDKFRMYPKYDEIAARSNRGKNKYAIAKAVREHTKDLVAAIDTHERVEMLLGAETLKKHGLSHPGPWTAASLKAAIGAFWHDAGLDGADTGAVFDPASLSLGARHTWQQYLAGEPVAETLPKYTFTRHRKAILAAGGPDIDHRAVGLANKLRSVGRQLDYDKRWRVPSELRKLVLCDATAPAIIEDLKQGLVYIRDGVLPDIGNGDARDAWLARWNRFVQNERLWDQQFGIHLNRDQSV